jgi:hypothetical protein
MRHDLTRADHLTYHTRGIDPAHVAAAQARQAERRKVGAGAVLMGAMAAHQERTIAAGADAELTPDQLAYCARAGVKPESFKLALKRRADKRARREGLDLLTGAERVRAAARMGAHQLAAGRTVATGQAFGSAQPIPRAV